MAKADNEVYTLTPKGAMVLAMAKGASAEEVWSTLRDFVELQARRNGYTDGVPALVFTADGGVCALVGIVDDAADKAKRRAKA